jgi:hypothetical protein
MDRIAAMRRGCHVNAIPDKRPIAEDLQLKNLVFALYSSVAHAFRGRRESLLAKMAPA